MFSIRPLAFRHQALHSAARVPRSLQVRAVKTAHKSHARPTKPQKKFDGESKRAQRRHDPQPYIFRPRQGRPTDHRPQAQSPEWSQRRAPIKSREMTWPRETTKPRVVTEPRDTTTSRQKGKRWGEREDQKVSTLVNKALAKYDIPPSQHPSAFVRKSGKQPKEGGRREAQDGAVVKFRRITSKKATGTLSVGSRTSFPVSERKETTPRKFNDTRNSKHGPDAQGTNMVPSKAYIAIDGRQIERKSPSKTWQVAKRKFNVAILLEKGGLVVVNKPPAILSQPGLPGEGTILDLLERDHAHLMPLQVIHRLDKNTSGVMILGRNDDTLSKLHDLLRKGQIEKNYLALIKPRPGTPLFSPDLTSCARLTLTEESPTTTRGTFIKQAHLPRGSSQTSNRHTLPEHGKVVLFQTLDGETWGYILSYCPSTHEKMMTHFQQLLRLDRTGKVLVQFTPMTGKKHQIRLHSAFLLGAPIVGDHRYGYPDNIGHVKSRIEDDVHKDATALHCYRMAYAPNESENPGSSKNLMFDVCAELPAESWGSVWDCVRGHTQERGFKEMVKLVSGKAGLAFERWEVRRLQRDPDGWVKDLKRVWMKNREGKWEERTAQFESEKEVNEAIGEVSHGRGKMGRKRD